MRAFTIQSYCLHSSLVEEFACIALPSNDQQSLANTTPRTSPSSVIHSAWARPLKAQTCSSRAGSSGPTLGNSMMMSGLLGFWGSLETNTSIIPRCRTGRVGVAFILLKRELGCPERLVFERATSLAVEWSRDNMLTFRRDAHFS